MCPTYVIIYAPNDDKIRVSARINKDLYDSVLIIDDNFTRALVSGLTSFIEPKEKECQTDYDNIKLLSESIEKKGRPWWRFW